MQSGFAFAHGTAVFRPASDNSLLIYFDQQISLAAHQQVAKQLRLLELRPNYRHRQSSYCLLLRLGQVRCSQVAPRLETRLRSYLDRLDEASLLEPRHRKIPVCYSGECPADFVPSDVG
jgi:hypothetical protein